MNYRPLTMIMQTVLLLLFVSGTVHGAFSGPVEIKSIQIVPTETIVGKHPEITGSMKASTVSNVDKTLNMIVIAAVIRPDSVMKSWTWKDVDMKAGEIRSFSIPKEYEITSAGTYKVDFSIYSNEMKPLHRLSQTFVAVDPLLPPSIPTSPEKKGVGESSSSSGKSVDHSSEGWNIGLGAYASLLNSTGGGTIIVWPLKYMGLQASYTGGLFTTAEGRLLARIPPALGINPYFGIGYLNVTTIRKVEVIDVKTRFKGSGVSGVLGAEVPITRNVFGYIELCGASLSLKKEVTDGVTYGTTDVRFAPVSIGIGIVYFLF